MSFNSLSLLSLSFLLIGSGCLSSQNTSLPIQKDVSPITVANTNHIAIQKDVINLTTTSTTIDMVSSSKKILTDTLSVSQVIEPLIKQFTITAHNSEFTPSSLSVHIGDSINLQLVSDQTFTFSFPAFNIKQVITPQKIETFQFIAKRSGSYSYSCSQGCESAQMTGVLFVRE